MKINRLIYQQLFMNLNICIKKQALFQKTPVSGSLFSIMRLQTAAENACGNRLLRLRAYGVYQFSHAVHHNLRLIARLHRPDAARRARCDYIARIKRFKSADIFLSLIHI